MAEKLDDRRVKTATTTTAVYLHDSLIRGLALRVGVNGEKSWSVRYRVNRKQRRLTLGPYPVLGLAKARAAAKAALLKAANGVDPAEQKQQRRDADTVADFAKTYIEKHAKVKKKSWRADAMRLKMDVLPRWKHRLMRDITRPDVRELLDGIAARPAPIVANRVRSLLHKLFNVAMRLDVVETNPVTGTDRPGVEHERERHLSDDELRTLWTEFGALDPRMAAFYKLRLLTAQRGGEVASMRWSDVDLESCWWTIPGSEAKNEKSHRVPLNASALAIVKSLTPNAEDDLTGSSARKTYVLAGARGKRQQSEAAATFTVRDFRGHDLRRTASTQMASGQIPRLTIAKILNHAETTVTAVYDRHSYDPEKQAALTWWDAKLTAILAKKSASVLPFSKGA